MMRRMLITIMALLLALPALAGDWEVTHVFPQWFVILDVACAGPDNVWVVGINEQTNTNQIYYSSDAGDSWAMQYSGMDLSTFLVGIDMADEDHGAIAGTFILVMPSDGCGAITGDGGETWNGIPSPDWFSGSFLSANARTAQEIHLVGGWGFDDIKGLWSTHDGGGSWSARVIPAAHGVRYASFLGTQKIWVTGGAWPEDEGAGDSPKPPHQYMPGEKWTDGGERTGQYEASIWHSADDGASWTEQFSSTHIGYMNGIVMMDESTGLAVGTGDALTSQIYRTANGGATWTRIHFPSEDDHILVDIEMVSASEGWAVGYSPDGPGGQPGTAIVHTTDAGLSWERYPINEATALLGISMVDEHRGFTAGGNNLKISRVIRYDDGFYGDETATGETPGLAADLSLSAHPNPFNPQTTIRFAIASEQKVELGIYDSRGRKLARLTSGVYGAGEHAVIWNGRDGQGNPCPSGVYFARLIGENAFASSKLTLLE